jgi:hypothetical protein
MNLILWLKNEKKRIIHFEPNKINIITGDSNTGKTAILDIIDYCFLASKHSISESMINENVEWYGIKFFINDKSYTIARKAPSGNTVSDDYYFSSIGEIPDIFPEYNITGVALKKSLEVDFGIDQDIKFTYGGKFLKADSKISLRYFLLFNTISQNIITHSKDFFDKQEDDRYREALPRTFDLAVGIDTAENILKREKREEIERELRKIEREQAKLSRKQDVFYSQLTDTVKIAKEFALISNDEDVDDAVLQLKEMVTNVEENLGRGIPEKYDTLSKEINLLTLKIRNLERFANECKNYKANLKKTEDSLKPIDFLTEHHGELIKTSIYYELVSKLKEDYMGIKKSIADKTPLDRNISDLIKDYEKKLKNLQNQRDTLPKDIKTFESNKNKYIFIGETKAKIALYERDGVEDGGAEKTKISRLEAELNNIIVEPTEDRKNLFVKVLDETVQDYINKTKDALENYSEYLSSFDYKEKKLQIRKPKTELIENVGSSSNHMFLHLFLFLGLHELIIKKNVPHVPPFLIIDQFSRPYWGEGKRKKDNLDTTDTTKVESALNLLNSFVQSIKDAGNNFQMIIFEHINHELWENLENVHLVEEFRDGNALIPKDILVTEKVEEL